MSKTVAIYARVSTMGQADDGFGLDVQFKELISLAEHKGYSYKEYVDRGISGTSIEKRLGLQGLLEDIKKGDISEVWVTKLSRLGRNARDVLNIFHEFDLYNVSFKSIRDGIDTSNSMGKIILQFMAMVAEMERDTIIETTRAGADFRATIGKIYGGPSILGYNRIKTTKDSYIEIHEEEAKIVREIFALYVGGYGYKAIVTRLNDAKHQTKKGNLFSNASIRGILTNPIYVGKIRYNYHKDWNKKRRRGKQDEYICVDGLHEAIIDIVTWEKSQRLLSENAVPKPVATGKFLLNGILKCPQCGSGMVASYRYRKTKSGKIKIAHYICGAHHSKGRNACQANTVKADVVESLVLKAISHFLMEHSLADELHDYITNKAVNEETLTFQVKQLDEALNTLQKKAKRIEEMFEDGVITRTEMKGKLSKHNDSIEKVKRERLGLINQINHEEGTSVDISKEELQELLNSMYKIFTESNDRLLIKQFLRTVITSIKIHNRTKANMEVNLSFTEHLLELLDKDVPTGIKFSFDKQIKQD